MQRIYFPFMISVWLMLTLSAFSQNFHFEVLTNMNNAQMLSLKNDSIFCATTGGLVVYKLNDKSYQTWNASNGILDQDLSALTFTPYGGVVLGTANGTLNYMDLKNGSFQQDIELKDNAIVSLVAVGDTLWIAGKKIVAVYMYDHQAGKYSFRDFFTNYGKNVGQFHQIFYHNRRIWVTADNGVYSAPGNFFRYNLKSADNWSIYDDSNGLPSGDIYSINDLADTLLIGSTNGLVKFHNNQFQVFNNGLFDRKIKHIKIYDSVIWVDNGKQIYRLNGNQFELAYQTSGTTINDFEITPEGEIWAGLEEKGLKNLSSGERLWVNGPIDNSLGESILDSHGRLWVVSGAYKDERGKGFSVLMNNGEWINFRHLGSWRATASAQCLEEDADGNIWIGSWNGGFLVADPELNFYHFNNYYVDGQVWRVSGSVDDTLTFTPPDSVRHFFSHTRTAPHLLVVTDIMYDRRRQNMWLLTSEVQDGLPIARLGYPAWNASAYDSLQWQRIGYPYGINVTNDQSTVITQDIFGNIWIGTENDGIVGFNINENETLDFIQLDENDLLKNGKCWALAGDQDGYVWIGTHGGLNAYFNGQVLDFREDYQPIGLRINAIFVDSENNKWFATDAGVSLLKAAGSPWDKNSWVHFVPKNSERFGDNIYHTNLPSEEVRGIYVDPNTGDVYCGTSSGLAIMRSNPFTTPLPDYEKTIAGPNPFIIHDNQSNSFYFRNLIANSEIKILTASGRLVRVLSGDSGEILGSLAIWDGRNEDGRLVSSGVYLYMITDETGKSTSGKILVIKK
ncbi:MAG: hypothetical protein Kow0037_23150 [Calditrichia bacterium]